MSENNQDLNAVDGEIEPLQDDALEDVSGGMCSLAFCSSSQKQEEA